MNYDHLTNPEIVALGEEEREKALAALSDDRRGEIEKAIAAQIEPDGARAATLERLGREKQITDSQAWTADGQSPNSPLVTGAAAAKFTEAENPEAVIDEMATATAEKAGGDLLAAAGHDTSKTLSSDEAAEPVKVSASMKREELDAVATSLGLNPADYANKDEIIAAIEEAQGE